MRRVYAVSLGRASKEGFLCIPKVSLLETCGGMYSLTFVYLCS